MSPGADLTKPYRATVLSPPNTAMPWSLFSFMALSCMCERTIVTLIAQGWQTLMSPGADLTKPYRATVLSPPNTAMPWSLFSFMALSCMCSSLKTSMLKL
eukprot:s1765_g20.t1